MPKPSTKRWNKFDKGQRELGRKRRPYYLTDSEKVIVDQLISEIRCETDQFIKDIRREKWNGLKVEN